MPTLVAFVSTWPASRAIQDLLAIARHLPVPRDAPPAGRLHDVVGSRRESSPSHSPIRHATYWSSRITASVMISREVCALPSHAAS